MLLRRLGWHGSGAKHGIVGDFVVRRFFNRILQFELDGIFQQLFRVVGQYWLDCVFLLRRNVIELRIEQLNGQFVWHKLDLNRIIKFCRIGAWKLSGPDVGAFH